MNDRTNSITIPVQYADTTCPTTIVIGAQVGVDSDEHVVAEVTDERWPAPIVRNMTFDWRSSDTPLADLLHQLAGSVAVQERAEVERVYYARVARKALEFHRDVHYRTSGMNDAIALAFGYIEPPNSTPGIDVDSEPSQSEVNRVRRIIDGMTR